MHLAALSSAELHRLHLAGSAQEWASAGHIATLQARLTSAGIWVRSSAVSTCRCHSLGTHLNAMQLLASLPPDRGTSRLLL